MSEHLKLFRTQAEYEASERGSQSAVTYVLYSHERLDLISGNNLPTRINGESGTTEFLGDGYYLLGVYDSASTGLIGQYVRYPEGDLPSGTTVTTYGGLVKSGNTWVWDETVSHTQTISHTYFCALHNGKRYYSWNDPEVFGRFGVNMYENDEVPGTYKNVGSTYNAHPVTTPKNYLDGITSVVPGVGYINDGSKAVKYNAKPLPKLDLLKSQCGTSITWEEYGITDGTYAKYCELINHGDSLLETFNVTLDNENLVKARLDGDDVMFWFNDEWYIEIRPEGHTIIVDKERYL